MARPRTSAPKIYLHQSSGWYCANFSRQRVRLGRTKHEAEDRYGEKLSQWLRNGRTPPVAPVLAAVVAATLPHLSPTIRAMAQVAQLTGMRPGEVCIMRRCDLATSATESVDVPIRGGKVIRVSAVVEGGALVWAYAPPTHKNRWRGKPRLIPIPPAAQDVLRPFLTGREPDAYLFSPLEASNAWRAKRKRKKKYGRGRQPGTRYTSQSFSKAIGKAAKKAGAPAWSAGQLRHAAAQHADEHGGRDAAASLLGHAHPDVTATYVSDTFRKAARASLAGRK